MMQERMGCTGREIWRGEGQRGRDGKLEKRGEEMRGVA